jgi:hypothetical protein
MVPTLRDESESKEFVLVLLSIELVPVLIPRSQTDVGKDYGTYAGDWGNIEGGLGTVGRPWKVVDEEMKGEVQLINGERKVCRNRCANVMPSKLGLAIIDRAVV